MGDPAWATLTKAGHVVKDFTRAEAVRFLGTQVPNNLPAVVVLAYNPDGKTGRVVRTTALPTTGPDILKLADSVPTAAP